MLTEETLKRAAEDCSFRVILESFRNAKTDEARLTSQIFLNALFNQVEESINNDKEDAA